MLGAAQEEACDRGDPIDGLAARYPALERAKIGVRDRLVTCNREQQGDVDIDAFGEQLLDGGDPWHRARNLDEEVRPIYLPPQPASFLDGRPRIPLIAHVLIDLPD